MTQPTVVLGQTTFVYDGTPKQPQVVSVKDGSTLIPASEYQVDILYENNVNANEGAVAVLRDAASGNYILPSRLEVPFTILKAASELQELTISSPDITYGEVFTVSFHPELLRQRSLLARTFAVSPEPTCVELYYKGKKIAEDLTGITTGSFATFTVDTLDHVLPASEFDGKTHEFTIKWGGDSNLHPSVGTVRAKLHKKPVTAVVQPGVTRRYDGTTTVREALPLTVAVNQGDAVAAAATGTMDRKAVGTRAFNAAGVTLSGKDAGYYSLAPKDVSGSLKVTPMPLSLAWSDLTLTYSGGSQAPSAQAKTPVESDDVLLHVAGAQTDAGTYEARVSWDGADLENYLLPDEDTHEFEIKPAAAVLTAPPVANHLVYNGQSQPLVAPGSTDDGTLVYSLAEGGPYHEAIPAQTLSGSYRVWYKIVGDGNHYDSAPQALDVTIQAKALPPQTGGRSPLALSLLLMGGSLAGLVLAASIFKKRSALK